MGYYTRIGQGVDDFMAKVTSKKKKHCGWCKYNDYRCTSNDVVATCDFRTLALNKEAVVTRIKEEKKFLDSLKANKTDEEVAMRAVDILSGISIMVKYLEEEHNMNSEEIMKDIGVPEMSWAAKMKLVMKMKAMKKTRGK